jgi:molecular chaperone IbpA
MRTYDFSTLNSATVGFDQIADLMNRVTATDNSANSFPPYNIEKTSDDAYCISIAVAGFSNEDLSVDVKEKSLIVSAKKAEKEDKTYLHRGIATRAFERKFHLADHVAVTGASHSDGMLNIELVKELPEALKPRRIAITGQNSDSGELVDAKAVN